MLNNIISIYYNPALSANLETKEKKTEKFIKPIWESYNGRTSVDYHI